MKPLTFIRWCVALLAGPLVACHAPTSPSPFVIANPTPGHILARRAVWAAHGLTDYAYTYEFHALNALADQTIRLGVHQDTVRSAVLVATGRALAPPPYFPTINKLFDLALADATAGSLRVIAFDPALGYPVHMQITANPDALQSVEASALQAP